MKKLSLILLLSIIHTLCLPVIIESNKLATILEHIQPGKKTVVIFDLDNTVFTAPGDAGSDQWFTHELVQSKKPIEEVLPIYFKLQEKLSLELTEKDTPELISNLLEENVIVIGLTARSPELEPRTISELTRLGIGFSTILSHDIENPKFHYHSGVVFVGSRDKGEVFKEVLEESDLHPKNVIMADDKEKYLTSVEKVVTNLGAEFTGIRYSGMDERVKNFDPVRAEQEKKQLLGE
jgi:FMN phosphatase YigB (HAD superfamily)